MTEPSGIPPSHPKNNFCEASSRYEKSNTMNEFINESFIVLLF